MPPYIYAENEERPYNPHPLLTFLQSQSQNTLTRLYQRPSSCLSIFRLLAPLERQITMNLLWLESAIATQAMSAWVIRESKCEKLYNDALETLGNLHILPKSPVKLALNATFKSSFRQAITGGGTSGSFGVPSEKDDKKQSVDLETLDNFALEKWEFATVDNIALHGIFVKIWSTTKKALSRCFVPLTTERPDDKFPTRIPTITSAGFQFVLHTPNDQLWDLLLQYFHLAEERQMDLVEVLGFIFMLSTMELGREYSTENLSGTQKAMLEDLRDYGLIWQRKPTSRRFNPTRLATTLTSSSPPLPTSTGGSSGLQEGFIILETNYRVYAYTDNPLQIAVLGLFVSLKYRFPNLVVGSITRESVKEALSSGISADQIISYLVTHAHLQMRKNNPLIPVTVQDQIRLWELERNRLKSHEGYLYTAFQSQADYEFVLNYAKELNVVLWENVTKRCFFGSLDGHANIKGFIERRKIPS